MAKGDSVVSSEVGESSEEIELPKGDVSVSSEVVKGEWTEGDPAKGNSSVSYSEVDSESEVSRRLKGLLSREKSEVERSR